MVSESSLGGDFQRISQPRNAAVTNAVWNSMRTGARSIENTSSINMLTVTRNMPPNSFAPRNIISSTLRIFGRNNKVAVALNRARASSGCHCGHIGNSCRGLTKYCGSTRVCNASMPVDNTRNRNHKGADK
ncbi:hypothetical protein ASE07_07855 [Noviherbaspirillum sp. Root189]|nr:hypothetical protein ASE07_07855 [Noviherbaspirillum sp. Root189]